MIDYEEEWLFTLLGKTSGSVGCRACCFALPAAILTLGLMILDEFAPEIREQAKFRNLSNSTIWAATSGLLIVMIGFRTRNAYGRFWEGTGLLHQMRGEWFDTVSNCVTFSIKAKNAKPVEVMQFRHTLVRLMSLAHGNALEEISGNCFELDTIDAHGLEKETLCHLKVCHEHHGFNKVEVLLHLIQSLITSAHIDGILEIPPPILSRVFQTISRGFVNLLNTKKITDTRFPFPYVQLIAALMLAFTVMTPVLLSSFIENYLVAAVATFIPVFAVSSLNSISQELENPFGQDENDLPITHFQEEMDSCLLMLLHPNADLIAKIGPKAEMDFENLMETFNSKGEETQPRRISRVSQDSDEKNLRRFDTRKLAADDIDVKNILDEEEDDDDEFTQKRPSMNSSTASSVSEAPATPVTPITPTATKLGATSQPKQPSVGSVQPSVGSASQNIPQPAIALDIQPYLDKSSTAFVKSLESLTKVLEYQVQLLSQNASTLRVAAGHDVDVHFPTDERIPSIAIREDSKFKSFEELGKRWEHKQSRPVNAPSDDATDHLLNLKGLHEH